MHSDIFVNFPLYTYLNALGEHLMAYIYREKFTSMSISVLYETTERLTPGVLTRPQGVMFGGFLPDTPKGQIF